MTNPKEETFFEGGPANADLIINLLAGITLIGLPFTFGAIVRALWVRYLITSRRVSVTGGWFGRDKSQVVYRFIADKIICTPASGEVLCLNSANLIVLDDSLPNWLIATLLQSSISQSFFRLNFNSTKVLKSHILSIPLPNLDNNTVLNLLSSYEDLKSRKISKEIYFEFVNSVVNQHFMLSDGELAMLTAR